MGITPGLCVGSADFGSLAGVAPFNTSTNTIVFLPEDEATGLLKLTNANPLVRVRALSKVYVFDGNQLEEGWHSTTDVLHYTTNWSALQTAHGLNDIATDGTNNYVVVGNGEIWSSAGSDTNWVARFPFTNGVYFNAVVCQGGRWIAGGIGASSVGISATSTDRTNWTYAALANNIYDMATSGTNTVAAAGSVLLTTANGSTWTSYSSHDQTNSGAAAYAMSWDGSTFTSVGACGTNAWQAVGSGTSWTEIQYGQIVNGVLTRPQANGLATGHDAVNSRTLACAAYTDTYYGSGYASYQSTRDATRFLLWAMSPVYQKQRTTTNVCASVAYFNGNFIVATHP